MVGIRYISVHGTPVREKSICFIWRENTRQYGIMHKKISELLYNLSIEIMKKKDIINITIPVSQTTKRTTTPVS